jgi:phytoene dehydrogenase-like protein
MSAAPRVFLHQQIGRRDRSEFRFRVVEPEPSLRLRQCGFRGRREIRLGAEVSEAIVDRARVTGVRLTTGEELGASHVISSADPKRTFSWIDPTWLDPELLRAVDNIRMRGSSARVHFALDALPQFQAGGREVPRDALGGTPSSHRQSMIERAYDAAKFGNTPESPALSHRPTDDPSLADR